jgi:hypothetical protein
MFDGIVVYSDAYRYDEGYGDANSDENDDENGDSEDGDNVMNQI